VMHDKGGPSATNADAESGVDTRIVYAARLVLSRQPTAHELAVLRRFYQQALAMPRPPSVVKASLHLSPSSFGKQAHATELDALTAVASVLFNLDAALER
jgi:hypothetical protein